jgi:FADH2 O2-dependent halogenase
MLELDGDVAILGAGFGGSLTALILQRIGLRPVLIEKSRHPRFALGESSTPVANIVWQDLCRRYDLPRLLPLGEFGSWQRIYPELPCGLKRGFSYFQHQTGQPFVPRADHANELLVAASASSDDADTHWLRADFDQFLVREVQAAGIAYVDETEVVKVDGGRWTVDGGRNSSLLHPPSTVHRPPPWQIDATRHGEPVRVTTDFIIDASGEGQVLAKQLGIATSPDGMRTNSRAVFGHFTGVKPWRDWLADHGGNINDHPFGCDDAALHHIFDGGWMWVLPFNNGVTSAGFMLDTERFPFDQSLSAADEWQAWLRRFPSIAWQFANAKLTPACGGIRRTGRLQRRAVQVAGPNWAMLPLTVYSLDALHSTGNAHTLVSIERLVRALELDNVDDRTAALSRYASAIHNELSHLDRLVHGGYQSFARFDLFTNFAMFYFAAATMSENRRRCGLGQPGDQFLLADDSRFRSLVDQHHWELCRLTGAGSPSDDDVRRFQESVASGLSPYNIAGLCDPTKRNMYPFTVAVSLRETIHGQRSTGG